MSQMNGDGQNPGAPMPQVNPFAQLGLGQLWQPGPCAHKWVGPLGDPTNPWYIIMFQTSIGVLGFNYDKASAQGFVDEGMSVLSGGVDHFAGHATSRAGDRASGTVPSGDGRAAMTSVLQDWVMELPLREQGTLLTAVRGCDDEPKLWTARGIAESPGRRLTAWIRWAFMNPADAREIDIPGAFFQSQPPDPFKPSEFGHLPLHWYTHVMHALEVIGYRHPEADTVGLTAFALYQKMVETLHLRMEPKREMVKRLSEDRIASDTVVS